MQYLLLVVLIVIFMLVIIADKDIFSPAAIMCESYILAVLCAIINADLWDMTLSQKTFNLIIVGVLAFVVPSLIILHTYIKKKEQPQKLEKKEKTEFSINNRVYSLFIFLQVITIFLYLYYVIKTIGGLSSIFNLSLIIGTFREGTAYGDLESQIPTLVNQLVKISQIIGYISLYNFMYNKIALKRINKHKTLNILSMILYIILSMLSGGRYKMIAFFLAMIVMYFTLNYRVKKKNIKIKQVFKVTFIIVAILFIFSQTRTLVGRTNENSFVTYISSYFGGSIQLLNLYLDQPHVESEIFGKETFYAINNTLAKFNLVESYSIHLEFMTSNGVVVGNVYTSLKCFLQDFGYSGVIFLQALLAIIWTTWYKKIKRNDDVYSFDNSLLFYCMFVNCLFFNSYRDNFFSSTLSVSTLTLLIYFIIIKKLLINNSTKTITTKTTRSKEYE